MKKTSKLTYITNALMTLSIVVLGASGVQASSQERQLDSIVTCEFTEPFVSYRIDFDNRIVNRIIFVKNSPENAITQYNGVRTETVDSRDNALRRTAVFTESSGRLIELTLIRDMNGSDDMSDYRFPYSVTLRIFQSEGEYPWLEQFFGGCFSQNDPKIIDGLN